MKDFFQTFDCLFISFVKSKNVYSGYPVWLDSIAVGKGQHWTFKAESIGIATVKEHLPIPDKSCIATIFFKFILPPIT